MTTLKLSAAKPYWVWSVVTGFAFLESIEARDAFIRDNHFTNVNFMAGKLPVEEIATPEPVRMLALDPKAAPIASMPAGLFAALLECSAEDDVRSYIVDRLHLTPGNAYATDGYAVVHVADDSIKVAVNFPLVVHIDRRQIRRGLTKPTATVQVLDDMSVRIVDRGLTVYIDPNLAHPRDGIDPKMDVTLEKEKAKASVAGLTGIANPKFLARAHRVAEVLGMKGAGMAWRSPVADGTQFPGAFCFLQSIGTHSFIDGAVMPVAWSEDQVTKWWAAAGWAPPDDPQPDPASVAMPIEAVA